MEVRLHINILKLYLTSVSVNYLTFTKNIFLASVRAVQFGLYKIVFHIKPKVSYL